MILCPGTLLSILNYYRVTDTKNVKDVNRGKDIRNNNTFEDLYDKSISIFFSTQYSDEIEPEHTLVNKVKNCKRDIPHVQQLEYETLSTRKIKELKEQITDNLSDMFSENDKPLIILSILYLIEKDTSIEQESYNHFMRFFDQDKESFLHQSSYIFNELLQQTLFYVVLGKVRNTGGASKEELSSLNDICRKIASNPYTSDYKWDCNELKITIPHRYIFSSFINILSQEGIKHFIENVDPSSGVDIDLIEKFDQWKIVIDDANNDYLSYLDSNRGKNTALLYNHICDFWNKFNEYILYIGKRVTPYEIPKLRGLKKADFIGKKFNAARKYIRKSRTLKLAQYVKRDNKYHYTDIPMIIDGKTIKCFCENYYKLSFQLETENYRKQICRLYSIAAKDDINFSFSHGFGILYENHSSSKQSIFTDAEWEEIAPQIKAVYNPQKLSLKEVIETIIYIEVNNVSRGQWPNDFPNYNTIHRKRRDLQKSEIWTLIQSIVNKKKNTLPPT